MISPRGKSKNSSSPASPSINQEIDQVNSNDSRFSLLSTLEFKHIDETDPSLADGHKIIFDKELPVEVRTGAQAENPQDIGALEVLRVKVLTKNDEDDSVLHLRVELTSEGDLFFHYTYSLTREDYQVLQQKQKLMVDFSGFPNVLHKMLSSCADEPDSFIAIFAIDGVHGTLNFVQNMEYKFVDLMNLTFTETEEKVVRQHISFRYNSVKNRMSIMQHRLNDVCAIVKLKNPSLLLQLQRSVMQNALNNNSKKESKK